jgi:3-oxoacyl-[acyl-carrier protein] reductase
MAEGSKLTGAVAIVTGASAGIGEEIAKTLAREGASVAIASRNHAEGKRVAAEIGAAGGSAVAFQADVTRSADVTALVGAVVARWGTVDILVNGVGGWQRLALINEIPEDEWDRVITLNLKSAYLCAHAVSGIMMEKRKGHIVNLGSQSGSGPNQISLSNLPYATAKAGLIGFTRHLAKQLGPYGITVNTVSPGTTLTPRVAALWDEKHREKIASVNSMKCLVEPRDSAEAVLFLVSPESRYITGVNLDVNAGNR